MLKIDIYSANNSTFADCYGVPPGSCVLNLPIDDFKIDKTDT